MVEVLLHRKNLSQVKPILYTMKKLFSLMFLGGAAILMVMTSCNKPNNIPVVAGVMVNPSTVDAGATTTVTVTASDLDGDPLTYAYTVNGGAIQGTGAAVQWIAPSTAGAYSVTVTVSDGKGGQGIGSGALTVNELVKVTRVVGTCNFPAGTSGDLSNAKVSLYTSYDTWLNNQPIKFGAVTGSGSSVTFALNDVLPGNYYLDIWKDNDNNGLWSTGDFVGWYGSGGLGSPALTEFQITEGQTITVTISMFIM